MFRELQLLETVFQIRPETTIPPYAPVLRITSKSRQVGQPQSNGGESQHQASSDKLARLSTIWNTVGKKHSFSQLLNLFVWRPAMSAMSYLLSGSQAAEEPSKKTSKLVFIQKLVNPKHVVKKKNTSDFYSHRKILQNVLGVPNFHRFGKKLWVSFVRI